MLDVATVGRRIAGKLAPAALLVAAGMAVAQTGMPSPPVPADPSATASAAGAQAAITVDSTAETDAMIAAQNRAAGPMRPKTPGTPGALDGRAHEQPRR